MDILVGQSLAAVKDGEGGRAGGGALEEFRCKRAIRQI